MKKLPDNQIALLSTSEIDKKQILDNISAECAFEILKKLTEEDASISKRVKELIHQYQTVVDPDEIAESIFNGLNSFDVEEVWNNAGSTSYGYVDPYDLASEMFEETFDSYIDDFKKYQKHSMDEEAKLTRMGILRGLYMFDNDATTEFKGYVEDDPYSHYTEILEEWNEANKNPQMKEDMIEFTKKNFPKWAMRKI